jgi:hypothetical protein
MLWAIVAPTSIAPLPREIEADPRGAAIRTRLAGSGRRLWTGGTAMVPVLPLTPAGVAALGAARGAGHLVLGLEAVEEALANEARGLARRPGGEGGARVSRLLLVAEDGAERFYRRVERLAGEHAPRILVLMLADDAVALGRATVGRETPVKAVLARHKLAVASLLRALCAVDAGA